MFKNYKNILLFVKDTDINRIFINLLIDKSDCYHIKNFETFAAVQLNKNKIIITNIFDFKYRNETYFPDQIISYVFSNKIENYNRNYKFYDLILKIDLSESNYIEYMKDRYYYDDTELKILKKQTDRILKLNTIFHEQTY